MLPYRSHRCNAFKQDPEKEARLLCFSNTPGEEGNGQGSGKPIWLLTDTDLEAAVKNGIVGAQTELSMRQDIRNLMGVFKDRIVQTIEAGDEVDPAGADSTKNKEEFAQLFLQHDNTLNNTPSNNRMKEDYAKRILDDTRTVITPIAADVESHRRAVADALKQKIETLKNDCAAFAERLYPAKNPEEVVDDFIASRTKQKEKDQIQAERGSFVEAIKRKRVETVRSAFAQYVSTSQRSDPVKMVQDYYRSKNLPEPTDEEVNALLREAEEHLRKSLETELKEFAINGNAQGGRFRRKNEALEAFIQAKGVGTFEERILRNDSYKPSFEKAAETGICERHSTVRAEQIVSQYERLLGDIGETEEKVQAALLALQGKKNPDGTDPDLSPLRGWETLLRAHRLTAQINLAELEAIASWQKGTSDEPPTGLKPYIVASAPAGERAEVSSNFDRQIAHTANASPEEWSKMQGSLEKIQTKRKLAVDGLCTNDVVAVALAERLEALQQECSNIAGSISEAGVNDTADKLKEMADEIEKEELKKESEEKLQLSLFQRIQKLNNDLGITWITPYQVYMGVKKYIESYKASLEDVNRRKISGVTYGIAQAVAGIIPTTFNEAVSQRAKSNIDSEDNKVKDEFISTLKSGPASFDNLFGKDGFYDKNQQDYNLNRAVLEYAASRGWLYNIEVEKGIVMGRPLIEGINLPPGQDVKEYIDQLREANTKGMNSEKQRGVEIVDREGNFDNIFAEFQNQLTLRNYMAAVGIIERTIGKGKRPHTITQLTVAFVRHMRSDKEAWKYIHFNVIEALKGIGYSYPLFTTAMMDYSLPQTIKKSEKDPAAMRKGGVFTATLQKLENEIRAQTPDLNVEDPKDVKILDELVARALSGQVLSEHKDADGVEHKWGHTVSIFNDSYKAYRADMASSARPNNLSYEKMQDFLEGSELILAGNPVFDKIFSISSTSDFDNSEMAIQFSGDIIKRYDQLYDACESGKVSLETLRQYQEKFSDLWDEYFANTPRANSAEQANIRTKAGERVFEAMYIRGLISEETLKEKEAGGNKLAEAVLKNASSKQKKITPPTVRVSGTHPGSGAGAPPPVTAA